MSHLSKVPYKDLHQTIRFYERLGFTSRAEERGQELFLVLECEDISLEMQQEQELNPFKNSHVLLFSTGAVALSAQFVQQYQPEETECQGWVQTLKNGGVHIVDPNGNLLMISTKPKG